LSGRIRSAKGITLRSVAFDLCFFETGAGSPTLICAFSSLKDRLSVVTGDFDTLIAGVLGELADSRGCIGWDFELFADGVWKMLATGLSEA
jgi:hypothetical protein